MWRIWTNLLGINIGGYQITDENGLTTNGIILIVIVAALVIAFVYFWIKESKLEKIGENSAEKQRVAEIVKEVSNNDTSVTTAYAYWKTTEVKGNKRITRYWYYAIGFSKERIYVVPIWISDSRPRKITYKDYIMLEPEHLGLVNGNANWAELYDKEGNKLASLMVTPSETDSSASDQKVNITQREVAEKWQKEFIPYWMDKVNTANGTKATGYLNNAKRLDFAGQSDNVLGGGKAKNM